MLPASSIHPLQKVRKIRLRLTTSTGIALPHRTGRSDKSLDGFGNSSQRG
jgi:hypothetical protein